jgi:putative alpha-1,2-mannosidase
LSTFKTYCFWGSLPHHIAYLYAYTDKPEKGRQLISQICNEFYSNTTTGMIGNDDCGQMSAWYIFSTVGFYR